MQGAGGVGTDEFHLDFVALTHRRGTIAAVGGVDGRKHRSPGAGGNKEVDKPGARNVGFQDPVGGRFQMRLQDLGNLAGRHFLDLGHDHGQVG